jgi:hypothetical protein
MGPGSITHVGYAEFADIVDITRKLALPNEKHVC